MAIDKSKTRNLIEGINAAFEASTSGLSKEQRDWFKKNIMGAAFDEIERLVVESRPPVL
ncbi:MAG: hypothetical protein ACR2KW_00995 [Rubrobacter sp.]